MPATTLVVVSTPTVLPDGFEAVSPEQLTDPEPDLLVIDAAIDRAVLLDLLGRVSASEVVIWWRNDASPTLSTDDILRLGRPLVFDLEGLTPAEVPAGTTLPITVRPENAPSAEYVTLLGTPSARATLVDVTRAVSAMRRTTERPLWDPAAPAIDELRRPIDPAKVVGAWTASGDGTLVNIERPALASLLKRSNKETMDLFARHLDGLVAGGYRIPPAALILGETGTGKTVMARRLHEALYPDDHEVRSLVEVSAPTIRGSSFASEFFGHMEEAWTGTGYAIGPALEATFGTLFLDEVGDLDPRSQQSLLTFLVRRRARLQGAEAELFLPMQIVAATNRPLDRMVQDGSFRQDLYNRFPLVINLQPLHARFAGANDAERLISEVLSDTDVNPLRENGPRRGQPTITAVHELAIAELVAHDYRTGNFREFIDILRRAVLTASEQRCEVVLADHLVFPPTVIESLRGDPIPLARTLVDTVALLGHPMVEVVPDELTRLAARVDAPVFATTDERRLVIYGDVAWVDAE